MPDGLQRAPDEVELIDVVVQCGNSHFSNTPLVVPGNGCGMPIGTKCTGAPRAKAAGDCQPMSNGWSSIQDERTPGLPLARLALHGTRISPG
jgi:hypothetical protein